MAGYPNWGSVSTGPGSPADTSDVPHLTLELPAGYKKVSTQGISTDAQEDGRGGQPNVYSSIPEQK